MSPAGQTLLTLGVKGEPGVRTKRRIAPRSTSRTTSRSAAAGRCSSCRGTRPAPIGPTRPRSIARAASSSRGVERARRRGSSRSRTESRSTRRACSGSPTARISASRSRRRRRVRQEISTPAFLRALDIGSQHIYMVNGFAGQILRPRFERDGAGGHWQARQGRRGIPARRIHHGEPEGRPLRRRQRQRHTCGSSKKISNIC